jgi:putative transcriptional regulator
VIKNKIKTLRQNEKMTQKELAAKVGVTGDYISQIERGRIPGMDTAQKLAMLFDTTIDDLFFDNLQNSKFGRETA